MKTEIVGHAQNQLPIKVNPDLVWDYAIPSEKEQTEGFRRWYIARVLARGRIEDLRSITLPVIYQYFPLLNIPQETKQFWEWYLGLPEVQQRCANPDAVSTASIDCDRTITDFA